MSLPTNKKEAIKNLLCKTIDDKLKKYVRESGYMPFLTRLMQDNERVAAYSFTHSLVTTLGTSVYEQVSKVIVEGDCEEVFRQYDIGGVISNSQREVINNIVNDLGNGERTCDIKKETSEVIRADSRNGKYQKEGKIADLYIKRGKKRSIFLKLRPRNQTGVISSL